MLGGNRGVLGGVQGILGGNGIVLGRIQGIRGYLLGILGNLGGQVGWLIWRQFLVDASVLGLQPWCSALFGWPPVSVCRS